MAHDSGCVGDWGGKLSRGCLCRWIVLANAGMAAHRRLQLSVHVGLRYHYDLGRHVDFVLSTRNGSLFSEFSAARFPRADFLWRVSLPHATSRRLLSSTLA